MAPTYFSLEKNLYTDDDGVVHDVTVYRPMETAATRAKTPTNDTETIELLVEVTVNLKNYMESQGDRWNKGTRVTDMAYYNELITRFEGIEDLNLLNKQIREAHATWLAQWVEKDEQLREEWNSIEEFSPEWYKFYHDKFLVTGHEEKEGEPIKSIDALFRSKGLPILRLRNWDPKTGTTTLRKDSMVNYFKGVACEGMTMDKQTPYFDTLANKYFLQPDNYNIISKDSPDYEGSREQECAIDAEAENLNYFKSYFNVAELFKDGKIRRKKLKQKGRAYFYEKVTEVCDNLITEKQVSKLRIAIQKDKMVRFQKLQEALEVNDTCMDTVSAEEIGKLNSFVGQIANDFGDEMETAMDNVTKSLMSLM